MIDKGFVHKRHLSWYVLCKKEMMLQPKNQIRVNIEQVTKKPVVEKYSPLKKKKENKTERK